MERLGSLLYWGAWLLVIGLVIYGIGEHINHPALPPVPN